MSVHQMPPRDEPFDPRQAALSHAGAAAMMAEQGPQSLGEPDPRGIARVMGEVANAVACGLVYAGDEIRRARGAVPVSEGGRRTQAVADVLWLFDPDGKNMELRQWARDLLRTEIPTPSKPESPLVGAQVVGWDGADGGGVLVRVSTGATYRIQVGMPFEIPAKLDWSELDETARWREFLRDQAAQIPEGVESSLRELLSQLEGQSLEFELREPVQSLTDWLNQLANVREEVADGRAGE